VKPGAAGVGGDIVVRSNALDPRQINAPLAASGVEKAAVSVPKEPS
jgi:hypothetical protein